MSSLPKVDRFDQDWRRIGRLLLDGKMKPLEDFIAGFEGDFGLLCQSLKKDGFGQNSSGPTRKLWEVFVKVAEATDPKKSAEPWMLIRDLAVHLNHHGKDPKAASALMAGLIHHGETVSAMPSVVGTMREDLRRVNRPKNRPRLPTKVRRNKRVWPIGVALLAVCATLLYLRFDGELLWPWLKTFAGMPVSSTLAEIEPPVGTGQHFSLANVRYCHFQEERLRIMKETVRSAEDTRAFNMLAVDYNSRCSDFFYQDSDVAIVAAEIAANRARLADEARRMMSTWPGHATVPGFAPAK